MKQVRFTTVVIQDLKDIYNYIADDNLEAAARFLSQLQKRWLGLAENPGIGRKRDELKTELRSACEGDYVIYYRKISEGIELIRILHAKRDVNRLFEESDSTYPL